MTYQHKHTRIRWYKRASRKRGFALVASLTLMMLLGLIAVGILAIASSQNRIAAQTILQAEARQQALLGLDAAIAELQMHAGPDQRVTASSGILSADASTPQHILGVWNSWTAPLYGQSHGQQIQNTYGKARSSMFRRWLISSKDASALKDIQAIQNLGTRKPGERICLVGEGTLGKRTDNRNYIYADLISMPASGKNTACFAWWVGGENQKANISIRDREESNDPVEILRRTWDTPAPIFKESRTLSFMPEQIQDPEKLLTMNTLPLVERSAMEAGQPYYFDITPYSYSLPTNARDGGLKHDLNLLLNKKSLRSTEFAPRASQDCPIVEDRELPRGSEPNMPIGSWQVMHAFYNTWPDGSGQHSETFSSRLVGTVTSAFSRMSGNIVDGTAPGKDKVTFYDTRSVDGDRKAGYARTPVLISFMGAYGLTLDDPNMGVAGGNGNYSYGSTYAPFCSWWNPYNVEMRIQAKKLWIHSLPYRCTSLLLRAVVGSGANNYKWTRVPMLQSMGNGQGGYETVDGMNAYQGNVFANDWGNYFVNSSKDQTGDIVFGPGEILAFSMAEGWNNLRESTKGTLDTTKSISQPQKIPFISGDHADDLHNYYASHYSSNYGGNHCGMDLTLAFETSSLYSQIGGGNITNLDGDDGAFSNGKNFNTAGDVWGPQQRECFVVTHGFDGIDASSEANKSPKESRISSKVYRFVGAGGISSNHFMLGWFDYSSAKEEGVTLASAEDNFTWNSAMYGADPYYFVTFGVAPKSYNPGFNEGLPMFQGKDYRTKNWQHSSPALGSSAIYRPDDQQRQYHPYQLAVMKLEVGAGRGVQDTVNSRNGIYGITSAGSGGGESVSFIPVLELPMHPPCSLAAFSGMRLTPGWYDNGESGSDGSIARARRIQYQAGVPGVGIGNSFADPCLPSDDVYAYHENSIKTDVSSNGKLFSDFFDHALLINDELWDRWFCSSVTDMPAGKSGIRKAQQVFEDFMNGTEPLPVSRYKLNSTHANQQEIIRKVMGGDGWKEIARYLMIEGGFNVNSVSEEAWTGILMGLSKRKLVSNANLGSVLRIVDQERDKVMFSRFMVSTSNSSIDDKGYNVLQGSASLRPNMKFATAWGEIRALDPDMIRELAKEIVKKVRERGPFLNMSDFINRRLDGGTDAALTGALQAAIDATDINQVFNAPEYQVTPATGGNLYKFPKAEEGSMYTAAPGYLIQSDVLSSLGNILTVRDDTFTVRAYGCVRNARNAILAQAWCEAVVQRTIDYVDPNNKPEDSDRDDSSGRSGKNAPLTELNRVMGRKFRVVSFKWLDIWDI